MRIGGASSRRVDFSGLTGDFHGCLDVLQPAAGDDREHIRMLFYHTVAGGPLDAGNGRGSRGLGEDAAQPGGGLHRFGDFVVAYPYEKKGTALESFQL